ncbi:hypothetical protein C4577_01340 [Candidatus Parcubacteria bacterium]|nr:MAG: hypothetical protein C4577_01340 [Candidatus Parcubacteria bacterium]
MNNLKLATATHQKAFDLVKKYFEKEERVLALSLTGSAARNEGSFDSDLDFDIFFKEGANKDQVISGAEKLLKEEIYSKPKDDIGIYFGVDLHSRKFVIDVPDRDWTSGPDSFELEIGNTFIYSCLIFEREDSFTKAKERYWPYYDENLRKTRLNEVLTYCSNNVWHIKPYVKRELYFQAFKRFYDATREFMQALFIAKKTYPIAYDKWIKKQFVEMLKLPELYPQFVNLYEVHNLESDELVKKGSILLQLVDKYTESI